MPVESTNNTNQGKQIAILGEKIENLTSIIRTLVEKSDARDASLVIFQKDYYIEHQKLIGDVAKHDEDIVDIRADLKEVNSHTDQLRTKTLPIDDLKRLKEVVFGNGSIGLVGKVDRIELWMANQIWFQRLIVSSVVGEVIAVGLLVYHMFSK